MMNFLDFPQPLQVTTPATAMEGIRIIIIVYRIIL